MPFVPKWKHQEKRQRVKGNRREREDRKSVPVCSPVGQIGQPVATGSPTKLSEPIGDKNRLISIALKRAGFAGLEKNRGEKW